MSTYVQAERPLTVTTPLGPDTLFLVGFSGSEGLSRLFLYELQAIAKNEQKVPFDQLLGKKVTTHVMAPSGDKRHFSGICCRVAQGGRDPYFTTYRLEVVPEFWFLTRRAQSRIFQAKSVPDILKKVLEGLKVQYQLQGTYQPRDYCVQYRETDFNFASRLMEEEGMFYFFRHTENESTMVVADNPGAHPDVPFGSTAIFAPLVDTNVDEERIFTWEKIQELRAMKVTLWDHCFEKPHEHLEAQKDIQSSVGVGSVEHKLSLGAAAKLELYDWPGEYAQRFDGVGPGREDRPSDIQKIFQDNQRTAQIRMEQEAMPSLLISGESKLRQMTPGHKFTLERHHNADGSYVVTEVMHQANQSAVYRSGDTEEFFYNNTFSCIPAALPYRPRRVASKPVVPGTQTAVVVGPKGEELYTDKYGRVKVQFHWDRDGKNDQNSSCWIRVAQPIAGRRWGTSFWPRIGQEVVVDFLEGDPDQPIIVGCVYNADQMPPYLGDGPDSKHKDDNKVSGFKSNITKGGDGFNEWRFDDTKDKEQIFIHAQKNMDVRVKNDSMEHVLNDRHLIVGKDGKGNQYELVEKDKHLHVKENHVEKIDKAMVLSIGNNQDITIGGDQAAKVGGKVHLTVGGERQEKIGSKQVLQAGTEIHLKAGTKIILDAAQIVLVGSGGSISIGPGGIAIEGTPFTRINCGGGPPGSAQAAAPKTPQEAKPKDPTKADDAVTGQKSSS